MAVSESRRVTHTKVCLGVKLSLKWVSYRDIEILPLKGLSFIEVAHKLCE